MITVVRSIANLSPNDYSNRLVVVENGGGVFVSTGSAWIPLLTGSMADLTDKLDQIITALGNLNIQTTQQAVLTELINQGLTLDTIAANGGSGNLAKSAFGELLVTSPVAAYQIAFIHNKTPNGIIETTGTGGSIVYQDQLAQLSTGVSGGGFATIRSKRRMVYRPGEGISAKITAIFDTGAVVNSIQLAGFGHAEGGFFFGYDGDTFGVDRQKGGRIEIRTFQITTASTTAENVTVTLNGIAYSVPVTNSGSVNTTAAEIANFTYSSGADSWNVSQCGDYIYFAHFGTGVKAGAYSFTATTAVASINQDQAGAANVHEWTPQASWNGDELGFTLDPAKGNVYKIQLGYLGFAGINFFIKSPETGEFIKVHTIKYENNNTLPNIQDPTMQGLLAIASLGSTTDITIKSGSMEGETEGEIIILGQPNGTAITKTALATGSAWLNLVTIKVLNVYGDTNNKKINRGQIELEEASCVVIASKATEFAIFKNATITPTSGVIEYQAISNSMACKYEGSATITGGIPIIETGIKDSFFSDLKAKKEFGQANDTYTLAFRQIPSGGSPDATASLNWKEDI